MRGKANIVLGVLVAVVLASALVALIAMRSGAGDASSLRAVIHDGDGGVRELPLSQDAEVAVTTSRGTNVISVRDGSVFVSDADCDNHDCMRQGKIDAPGKQIICLPHELWIEIVADGQGAGEMDVDAVAGSGGDLDVVSR